MGGHISKLCPNRQIDEMESGVARSVFLPTPHFVRLVFNVPRMVHRFRAVVVVVLAMVCFTARGADLRGMLAGGGVRDVRDGSIEIRGRVDNPRAKRVRIGVCNSDGRISSVSVGVSDGEFIARYPQGFEAAPALRSGMLYLDAAEEDAEGEAQGVNGGGAARGANGTRCEIALVLFEEGRACPDLPQIFTDDFVDDRGRIDGDADQWGRARALVNHFMQSEAARRMGLRRAGFDLAESAHFEWFKRSASVFDFDQRDRDWGSPLGHRVARGFWQAVWDKWFNPSNDHPWDGDPTNRAASNYRPYTFANDLADLLVLNRMLLTADARVKDRRKKLGDEVLANLLAMQHTEEGNFALVESDGRQERYTRGAFRYGMFESGEWLTEGTGWFVHPRHRDFAGGGVFNGRCLWAIGEALKADSKGAMAPALSDALRLGLRFCLRDAVALGYARRVEGGKVVWNRSDGEHAYLLLGALAACSVDPDMSCEGIGDGEVSTLRRVVMDGLDGLASTAGPTGLWSRYGNGAAMDIAALALGAKIFPDAQGAGRWRDAARRAADRWMAMPIQDGEPTWGSPMFAHMVAEGTEGQVTFHLGKEERAHVSLYMGGHWIHALALLHDVTGDARYAERAHRIVCYYLGDNPIRVRLLNELGAVNNRVTDTDGDGVEDALHWDAYPESTAFVQIGLLHLLQTCPKKPEIPK